MPGSRRSPNRKEVMSKIDEVRALFVPGETVTCTENTYAREKGRGDFIGRTWIVDSVGKSVWAARGDGNWRGTFPTRVSDVISVDDESATWKIGRGDHV